MEADFHILHNNWPTFSEMKYENHVTGDRWWWHLQNFVIKNTDTVVTLTHPVCWSASVSADRDTAVASSTRRSISPLEQPDLPPGTNPAASVISTYNSRHHDDKD
jgi:hypothetical protein